MRGIDKIDSQTHLGAGSLELEGTGLTQERNMKGDPRDRFFPMVNIWYLLAGGGGESEER